MKFQKMLKGGWPEIIAFIILNVLMLLINMLVYGLATSPLTLVLFLLFMGMIIFYSYRKRFEGLGLNLTKKGSSFLFLKTCLPYILQTTLFAQMSLMIGWILMNLKDFQSARF